MRSNDFEKQLKSLAALEEPARRKLYLYVVGRGREVGRDEAARGTRVSRALAAFHLDKLVEAGLLETTFRRLSGRSGPGAGRPSKLYRRSSAQLDVTLPERRYELAAEVLTRALAGDGSEAAREAVRSAARDRGARLARDLAGGARRGDPLRVAARALEACGYEPRVAGGGEDELVLGNCPFDSLRTLSRDLVCGMNQALIEGLLAGLGAEGVRARLAPRPGACCVALRRSRT